MTTRIPSIVRGAANPMPANCKCSVAVIGAGAAGLVAAKELLRSGHRVQVLEQQEHVGGVWKYTDQTESDPLGLDPSRTRVHSSMYATLRTNLPREVMGFTDFPFDTTQGWSRDKRRFPGHAEVQAYLEAFAEFHKLQNHIRLGTRVESVSFLEEAGDQGSRRPSLHRAGRWRLTTRDEGGREGLQEFDAVVVANGHYAQPRVPPIIRAATWPGIEVHSHNFRSAEPFRGRSVVVVGAMSSGEDLSREIAAHTDQRVYLSARAWQNPAWGRPEAQDVPIAPHTNLFRAAFISELHGDGTVSFEDGRRTPGPVDAVLWCTGFEYSFPFLQGTAIDGRPIVSVEDGFVRPLYKQIFSAMEPSLSFLGLPWKVVPFPQCEAQARLVSKVLANEVALPPREEMLATAEKPLGPGVKQRHAHMLGDMQWAYNQELCEMMQERDLGRKVGPGSWRQRMYAATGMNKRSQPVEYRDRWEGEDPTILGEAGEEFAVWHVHRRRPEASYGSAV